MNHISALIERQKPAIKKALPAHISVERITRIALTAVRENRRLEACTPESFLGSLMIAAQLGLEPNTPLGQAYLIPYGTRCQFILGYRGEIELAYRTGLYSMIYAMEVFKDDEFDYCYGINPNLIHKPKPHLSSEKPIGYYAVYKLKDEGFGFTVMSYQEIYEHAKKYSKSFESGPWKSEFNEMAKKTVLKKVLKYAPASIELATAYKAEVVDHSFIEGELVADPIEEKNTPNLVDKLEEMKTEKLTLEEVKK